MTQQNTPKRFFTLYLPILSFVFLLLTGCGGGGGGTSTPAPSPTPTPAPTPQPPPTYVISGSIIDEELQPVSGALVSVDGIEADILTGEDGIFAIEHGETFASPVTVTVTADGFGAFASDIAISVGATETLFSLDEVISLETFEPWGFMEFTIESGTGGKPGQLRRQVAEQAIGDCDCEVSVAGRATKTGQKDSRLFGLLVIDVSGSTETNTIANQTVFDVQVQALKGLVDNLNSDIETHIGLIKFATEAELVVDFTTDFEALKNALDNMAPEPSGTASAATNYEAALDMVEATYSSINLNATDIKSVAFLSDGIPTAPFGSGTTQEAEDRTVAINAATRLNEQGITINSFPINVTSSLTTMPAISAITDGNYFKYDAENILSNIPKDSLVGILEVEIRNETTDFLADPVALSSDGAFSANVCLTSDSVNDVRITPVVCQDCNKDAYQIVKANCDVLEECSECAGQVTNLILQYTGIETNAAINVVQRIKGKDESLINVTVSQGDEFEFFGRNKDKTMGSSIEVYVNGELNTEITTSCGQNKVGPGLISGDFLVTKGYSRNGGLLCPVD